MSALVAGDTALELAGSATAAMDGGGPASGGRATSGCWRQCGASSQHWTIRDWRPTACTHSCCSLSRVAAVCLEWLLSSVRFFCLWCTSSLECLYWVDLSVVIRMFRGRTHSSVTLGIVLNGVFFHMKTCKIQECLKHGGKTVTANKFKRCQIQDCRLERRGQKQTLECHPDQDREQSNMQSCAAS